MNLKGINLAEANIKALNEASRRSKYHWKKDKPDPRDWIFQAVPLKTIPTRIDLRQWCSPIEDQGNLGSCTGNAIAGQIELINRKNASKTHDVSRLFIYYQERVYMNTVRWDSGAYIRDGLKAVNQIGAPLETLWPYIESRFAVKPSTAAFNDARNRKVTGYARCSNFTMVKNALASGNPVTVGFYVYSSFEGTQCTNTGVMPFPNTRTESFLGGHAVCLVGYDDNFRGTGQGYFIARNSWGTNWGDNGYFYMPYQVIQTTSMSSDFWTISVVRNP